MVDLAEQEVGLLDSIMILQERDSDRKSTLSCIKLIWIFRRA